VKTTTTVTEDAPELFEAPLYEFRDKINVNSNGVLSGSFNHKDSRGDWQQREWNLTGQKK
jgi:hypothetical protein